MPTNNKLLIPVLQEKAKTVNMSRSPIPFTLATIALFAISPALADVVSLTQDNFEKEVGQDRGALVEFYTPWCGHCKRLAPEYERLGTSFTKTKSVLIGKVNCDEQKEVCTKYKVSSYPTIKWFPKGSLEAFLSYDGERTAGAFADYINSEAGTNIKVGAVPKNVVTLSPDNFDEIVLNKTKDVLVDFYAPWCGHCNDLAPTYESLATVYKNDDHVVIANLDAHEHKELGDRYGVLGFPTLKFFPKGNKAGEEYEGRFDLDSFVNFINKKCGTSRDVKGQLTPTAGIVEALDKLVKEFMSVHDDSKKEVFSKIEEAENLDGPLARYGKLYIRIAHGCMAKGADYARNETQRLERMLSKTISPLKADEFTLKKNILSAFA